LKTIDADRTAGLGVENVAPYPTGPADTDQQRRAYAHYVSALWDEQTDGLRALHLTWELNLLFLGNQHWHSLTHSGWRQTPAEDWEKRPTTNLCLPYYVNFLAKSTKTRPATQVVPASSEPGDMQAAQLGDEVLEAKWVELACQKRYRALAGWTIATGNGFALPFWNTRSGKLRELTAPMEVPVYWAPGEPMLQDMGDGVMEPVTEVLDVPCDEDGEPMLGPDGRPRKGAMPHVIDAGEVDFRIFSPFQVRVNPEATCDEDVQSFTVAEPMSLREIHRRWPELAPHVMPEDVTQIMGTQATLAGLMRPLDGSSGPQVSPKDERVSQLPRALVKHYYEKQTPEYPQGRYWVSAGDVLLEDPQPLPDGLFCLIHMQDVEVPGRYHAMSRLEAVVSINRDYNELSARIAEHHELFASGKYAVPRQAGIRAGGITRRPGEVVEYNYPYEPKAMQIPALPQSVFADRERLLGDFERVSGMRAVSQGGTSGGVTAGIAIMQLQEADDADMGPFLQSGEEAVAKLAAAWLTLIQNNYTDERLYYAAGPGRRYMAKSFRASDLDGAVDVIPQSGSSRPGSEVARQAVVMELAKVAPFLFEDPERPGMPDAARFARALQLGGIESVYEAEDSDVSEALRIEDQLSRVGGVDEEGDVLELVTPQPWQNLEVHYRQHRRTLVGAQWREWPEEAQAALVQRFLAVKAAVEMARMQAQMAAAGMMGGQQEGAPEGGEDGGDGLGMGAAQDPLGAEADLLEQDMEMTSGGGILN
jgi:hypothetical protein